MSQPDVIVRVEGAVGRITLNRPQALHALTTAMCRLITDALVVWADNPIVKTVLIDHAGEKGFCAGGDIRMLAESAAGDGSAARAFFFTEYRLNELMFEYDKPIVTIMDGITMGGGVGLAMASRYRIVTERTTFAMPETGIGLFPDVGGGWFLPRLPGHIGRWLALTGARLKAADCLYADIATHFIDSAKLETFKAELIAGPQAIARLLGRFESDPGPAPLRAQRTDIDRAFDKESVEAILQALETQGGAWADAQRAILASKSPQTLKVAFRQLQRGRQARTFAENMAMEYRIGARVVQRHDFQEGVRAVIVDKDNAPVWRPATVEAVTETDLDEIFAPLPANEEWSPLPGGTQ